ncbi:hypothetical protein [Pseudomonas azerbaijanoccidentalis]
MGSNLWGHGGVMIDLTEAYPNRCPQNLSIEVIVIGQCESQKLSMAAQSPVWRALDSQSR